MKQNDNEVLDLPERCRLPPCFWVFLHLCLAAWIPAPPLIGVEAHPRSWPQAMARTPLPALSSLFIKTLYWPWCSSMTSGMSHSLCLCSFSAWNVRLPLHGVLSCLCHFLREPSKSPAVKTHLACHFYTSSEYASLASPYQCPTLYYIQCIYGYSCLAQEWSFMRQGLYLFGWQRHP